MAKKKTPEMESSSVGARGHVPRRGICALCPTLAPQRYALGTSGELRFGLRYALNSRHIYAKFRGCKRAYFQREMRRRHDIALYGKLVTRRSLACLFCCRS